METAANKLKQMLRKMAKSPPNKGKRCRLCNLPKGKAKLLTIALIEKRDNPLVIWPQVVNSLAQFDIETSRTSLNEHYHYHWSGRHEKS